MSLTRNLRRLDLRQHYVLYTAIRNHWNKDFKPAKYPETEEARIAAAKKYGLHPNEYKPCPDDGLGVGDYPEVPAISGEGRDPYYPWDSPELKRNFGEPLHREVDIMGEDRYDVSAKHRISFFAQWAQFLGTVFGAFAIYCWFENKKIFSARIPKQYPGDGKVHYTFEDE